MKNKFKNRFRRPPQPFWKIIFLAGSIFLGLCQLAAAQIIRPSPTPQVSTSVKKKTVVFKGMGITRSTPLSVRLSRQANPRSLSSAEKTAVLKEAMLASGVAVRNENFTSQAYAVLSAQTPFAADRGYLVFWGKLTTNSSAANPVIAFIDGGYDGIEIFIKPDQAGKWYLIDCKVSGEGTAPFYMAGPDGNTTEFSSFADGHLQSFLVSQNTNWQSFYIHRNTAWKFFSCEVTKAN